MADGSSPRDPERDDAPAEKGADESKKTRGKKEITRETELAHDRGAAGKKLHDKLLKRYADIQAGFIAQGQRADDQMDYWDCYNCQLSGFQAYSGNAQIYVPIVHNAINARATRFVNQLFPKGGRYVEVVSSDAEQPHAITALLEHYVRKAKLRTEVAFPLCVNGDVEGQYNVYVSWSTKARHVTWKEKKPIEVEGATIDGVGDEIEEMVSDVILDDHPVVEVIPDADVLIQPATCNSVPEALALGGSVTIIRRWTKAQMEEMVEDGDVVETEGNSCVADMEQAAGSSGGGQAGQVNPAKHHADAAGVKAKGKICLGYESWSMQKVDGKKRLVKTLYGGEKVVLSCRLNPYWSDRCPLISAPVKKVAGVIKGISPVAATTKLQYAANDALNEGMDSATYSLLPIIMTDPLKNPKTSTMILDLAAVWETNPNDTKFAEFPKLWQDAFAIVGSCQQQIFQTLSVTPAMMPQSTGGKNKRNQAEIALEQQVDILSTADAVTVLEEGIFSEILMRFAEMDAQFREDDITVRAFGNMGMRAAMETIPPQQMGNRYNFLWFGVEQARDAAQKQQQIALLNVIRGIPPQMIPGRRLNMVPALDSAVASVFSSRIAPYIFEDISKMYTYPAVQENEILLEGHVWPISPQDDDMAHIQEHQAALKDANQVGQAALRTHIAHHRMAQIQKAMAQMPQGSSPGTPGGAGPGIAGQPKSGAQPTMPRQMKQAPGAIPGDQMAKAGAVVPPRRA